MLERQRVVNTVTGHRHHVAALLQCNDHVLLLLGRDTTENIVGRGSLGKLRAVLGQGRGINRAGGGVHTRSLCGGGNRERVITREDLQRHTLTVEVLHNLRGVRAHVLAENHEQNRGSVRRNLLDGLTLLVTHHGRGMGQHHRAQTQSR